MGFDIIVRKDGSPLLLEVNSSPSLTIDHNSEFEGLSVRSIVDEVFDYFKFNLTQYFR